jgi:hypothetical protein
MRMKKSTPRSKKSTRFTGKIRTQAIVLVVIGVVAAAAMLITAGRSSQPTDIATHAKKASPSDAALLDTTLAADATAANMPAVETPAKTSAKSTPVTITGCLELANDSFRLKDTSGVEAAKARSWKSGFLKKRPAPIEVVDAANRLQLPTHVGQRVSVTGLLVDREMQGRSLKRIAVSCGLDPVSGTGLKTIARREQ